jgi:hypothetical protein
MPEILQIKDQPEYFPKFHIEPFYEEYIPGFRVICQETGNSKKVYFQIPAPIFQKLKSDDLENLKKQIHEWWLTLVFA